jgi:hypothetical protein
MLRKGLHGALPIPVLAPLPLHPGCWLQLRVTSRPNGGCTVARALVGRCVRPEQHARVARLISGSPPAARGEPLPTGGLSKTLRVLRLGKAEHREVVVIAA